MRRAHHSIGDIPEISGRRKESKPWTVLEAGAEARGEARVRVETFTVLLTERFGADDRIPEIAQRLAGRADYPAALAAASRAKPLSDF